jgi:GH35 family endo-1,4-beta-xylanase
MRMHALIWNTNQQPVWVQELIVAALGGDADAKAQLREEITERIGYYVRDRAKRFDAIDVLNESFHQPAYLDIFGIEGVADIYRETAEAIEHGGGDAQTFINEFNILQWSRRPPYDTDDTEPDPFANWYREHAEELLRHDARLGAIGVQYYADARQDISDRHSPARIVHVLHNLSLTGLPISLTEFGVSRGATPKQAATILSDTLRLMFGHPNGQTFLVFGFYRGATWDRAAEATLFDNDWSRSLPGKAYWELIDRWSTDETLTTDENGDVAFNVYYGEYLVTVGDKQYSLTITKGLSDYEVGP